MRRITTLVFFLTAHFCAPALGVTINFDVDAAGDPLPAPSLFDNATPLRDLYLPLGMQVRGGSDLDGAVILNRQGNFGVQPTSGDNFLAVNENTASVMQNGGVPRDPVRFLFPGGITSFSLQASGAVSDTPLLVVALDASNGTLASTTATAPAGAFVPLVLGNFGVAYEVRVQRDPYFLDDTFLMDDVSFTPVPEPASMLLVALMGSGAVARHRNSLRQIPR